MSGSQLTSNVLNVKVRHTHTHTHTRTHAHTQELHTGQYMSVRGLYMDSIDCVCGR